MRFCESNQVFYSYFQVNRRRGRGTEKAHACQLNVKPMSHKDSDRLAAKLRELI